jgi:protease I
MNSFICRRDFVKGSVAASALLSASKAFDGKPFANAADEINHPIAAKAVSSLREPLILPNGREYISALDPMAKEKPFLGKKIAVLVETEYIYDEIEYYKRRIPALGGEVSLLSYLWGKPSIDFVNDIDSPDRPITDIHRLTVTECVTQHDPGEFDIVICAANYVAVRLREVPPVGSLASPERTSSAPAVQFFARAMENRKILKAAMCHALWILTPRPDLLRNRRVICHTVVLADIHNAGAVYVPAENHVVIDNDLVTARSFADIEAFFDAIVTAAATTASSHVPESPSSKKDVLTRTAAKVSEALEARFAQVNINQAGIQRPVAKPAGKLVQADLDVAGEVKRITGVEFDSTRPPRHKPVLLVASKFGTWASELTLVAGTLLAAGYRVTIASEDGSPPHMLGPSLDPDFVDGAWRCSVVSPEERDLALKFLNPTSNQHALLRKENIFDLSRLARPPQIGDYLKDASLLAKYRDGLTETVGIADDYDAIIVAGGSGAIPGFMGDRGLQTLILAFNNLRKPIMGQCNGGLAIAQTIDPNTGKSILFGRAVTTHCLLDEYQNGWGWTSAFTESTDSFWSNGRFDLRAYSAEERWNQPGTTGNPLIDSEALFTNAVGPSGEFFSPAGTPYCVVVDDHIITCRTTPDGYPGVLALIAVLDGRPQLQGRFFINADERGRHQSFS